MPRFNPGLTLISHKLCPYVQRAVIALHELGVDFERIDIDLENPPDWFLHFSPLGKVPVLVIDGETVLFESAVIAEYINEAHAGALLSADPVEKARQRAWIEFASATLNDIGALYSAKDEKAYLRALDRLTGKWRALESVFGNGTWFGGDDFSLVDAAFGPVFRYLDVFEDFGELRFLADFPNVAAWRAALSARESVRHGVSPDYPRLLAEFVAMRDSWLAPDARAYLARQKKAVPLAANAA